MVRNFDPILVGSEVSSAGCRYESGCRHEWRVLKKHYDGQDRIDLVEFFCVHCLDVRVKSWRDVFDKLKQGGKK